MSADSSAPLLSEGLVRLRSFARAPRTVAESCELCSAPLGAAHRHLIEAETGRLACSCDPCALLFANHSSGRYREVPRDSFFLPNFQMTDAEWENLGVPIGLTFLFQSSRQARVVAVYPGPAGAIESFPAPEAWERIVSANPILEKFLPDAEALLVNRVDRARENYRAPIDACYRLVGLIRTEWRGISGGSEVWDKIKDFFKTLRQQSSPHA